MVGPPGASAAGIAAARRKPLARLRRRWAWVFLAPALMTAVLVAGWPLLRTAFLAFTDARLADPASGRWIGLENFRWIMGDPDWWRAVWNTAVFTGVSVALELALGLAFALLLDGAVLGRHGLRAVALIPWAVPTVVSAQMWSWMFHDVYGVFNDLGMRLGLLSAPVAWLAEPGTALGAVILADVWKATPFVTLLLLAGLQTMPAELHAAARLDGAGPVRRFLHITLPLLRPAIGVVLIFRTIDALRVFDLIYVMTSNSRATATVSVFARQQLIDFRETGYGSAASLLIFIMVGVVSVAYVAALRPNVEEAR